MDNVVLSGLSSPTAVRFAPGGRVVVAEKGGTVKVFPTLGSTTASVTIDLSAEVDNYWDRGLLGLALDPNFDTNGYLYVLYTYDHILGAAAPPPQWSDACPTPPGPTTDGCVVSGRLSRIQVSGTTVGPETVLDEGWCQQFPSHSIGDLHFGPDGALYVSSGDGANFNAADWGQFGGSLAGTPTPANPCGDPPNPIGTADTSPTGRGGALRAQSLRRPAGEPAVLNGSLLRLDPATGLAAPGNPLAGSTDPNAQRIAAYGFRNPFRFTFRPGTGEVWVGDVGWDTWEEVDRVAAPTASPVKDYGWPCDEGAAQQSGYSGLNLCTGLYADTTNPAVNPYYAYNHGSTVVAGESCPTASGSSITGMAFYAGGSYPSKYNGALLFGDHTRNCIWAMLPGSNGLPNPATIEDLVTGAANPVDLEIGPNGDLFYVDLEGNAVHRLTYSSGTGGTYSAAVAGMSPVAYWRLGEASGTTAADSAGTNTGTYAGSPTLGVPGLITADPNTAVRLDGVNDQVTVPNSASLNPTGQLSIAAWINADTWTSRNPRIVQKGINDNQYRLLVESGHLVFNITGVGTASATPPTTGARHFVVGTYDGSAIRLYVDDVLAATSVANGAIPATTDPLAIGNKPTSTNALDPFPGIIDELSIHTVALSTTQIDQLWKAGTGGGTSNTAPTAVASANPTSGSAPLAVAFTGSGSFDPDAGDTLTYSWDLNGDGVFGDSTAVNPTFTYANAGTFNAALIVTDNHGASSPAAAVPITVTSTNTAPVPVIDTPASALTWAVGDPISFSGHATDAQDGTLPASALSWQLVLYHCPSACHTHTIQSWSGVSSGSFNAPDHDYPSYLVLTLTATDSGGLTGTTSIRLDPKTVDLVFATSPALLALSINGTTMTGSPITKTVIQNSTNTVTAVSPQTLGGIEYSFSSWNDGSTSASRTIVAPMTGTSPPTMTAGFVPTSADLGVSKSGVLSGKSIAWTITVTDAAAGLDANQVTVTDVLATNLGALPAAFTSGGWTCAYTSSTSTVRCTLPSLAAGASSPLVLNTPVVSKKGNRVDNTANVTTTTREVTTSNNAAIASVRLR